MYCSCRPWGAPVHLFGDTLAAWLSGFREETREDGNRQRQEASQLARIKRYD